MNPQTREERWAVPAWPGGDQTRRVIRRGGSLLTWSDAGVREIEVATGKEIVRRPGRYRRAEVTKDVLVLVLDFSFRVTPRASEEMIWEGKSSQFLGAQGDSCYWRRNSAYGCSEAQTGKEVWSVSRASGLKPYSVLLPGILVSHDRHGVELLDVKTGQLIGEDRIPRFEIEETHVVSGRLILLGRNPLKVWAISVE